MGDISIPLQSVSLYDGQVFIRSNYRLDLGMDFLIGNMVFIRDASRKHLISMACIHLWSSAVKVHDSQAYRKMDVTREHISHILELTPVIPGRF